MPHFDVGVALSHKPRCKNRRHFAHRARLQSVQAYAVDLMLAWRAPDAYFHTDVASKHSTEFRRIDTKTVVSGFSGTVITAAAVVA